MDKAKKNDTIHAAADRMAANYKSSQIPMYGDALRMPNRNAVIEIIRDCQKLIFPVYYGDRDLLKLPPEQYSALLMEHIHEKLTRQITLTMPECDENCDRAYEIGTAFIERIPAIQELLLKDLSANFEGDPAAYSKEEVLLSYPGMFAIFIYRIAHELYENKVAMIPRMMSEYAHSQTGIDINPGAKIGEYFFIDHGTGVVVGETTIIGDNVKLYQGATLGALSPAGMATNPNVRRHPKVGNNVVIYANSTLLGGATEIGDNVVVGGNAFLTSSVEPDTIVSVKNPEMTFRGKHRKVILAEGAHVRLRTMRREDLDELYALLSDEAVMRWLEPPFSRAQTEDFLERAGLSEPPLVYAAENAEGEFLGYAIYHDYDEHSREIGWVLKPAFWHKGCADEMTVLLTALARREGKDAVIECVPEQTVSAHIARRHGFSYEGRADSCDIYRLRCEK